jgi:hypothetical protein
MLQREMPVMANIKKEVVQVPRHLIEACTCKQQAIALCVKWSGIQDGALAHMLTIDKGNFSRMMTGSAYFPPNKENLLQDICGNEAILDWCNWSRNKKSIPIDNSEKIAALEAELELMKGVA